MSDKKPLTVVAPDQSGLEAFSSYADLEREGRRRMSSDGRSAQQIANFVTTLNAWCRVHNRDKKAVIKDDFDTRFDKMFLHFQDVLSESIATRTLNDRCEQMLWWRRLLEALRGHDTLPASFSEALTVAFARSGLTKVALGRMAGLSLPALNRWLATNENFVEPGLEQHVTAVELALDLSPGTLRRRISVRRRARYERVKLKPNGGPQTTYGVRMQRNRKRLPRYGFKFTERLKHQWQALIVLKTDADRPFATQRNTWRVKPASRVGLPRHWSTNVNGGVCVTAFGHYGQIRGFLGFLGLSQTHGGLGLPSGDLDTLAWLIKSDYVISYIKFVRRRADGILHNGLFTLLNTFRSHLRPQTGYVWLNEELGATLPPAVWMQSESSTLTRKEAWQARCEEAYNALMAYTSKLTSEGKTQRSRDPAERLQAIVADEFPMKEMLRVIHALENDPPRQGQQRGYAVWLRDLLLLKMLVRHPLRAQHFSVMTFRGPAANLFRTNSGWQLHFDLNEFKNAKSRTTTAYTVALDATLVPWLNRYLSEARECLVGAADCDYLLLPSSEGNRTALRDEDVSEMEPNGCWSPGGISTRLKTVTGRYSSDGMAWAGHSFRHIVATDHLKRNPREFAVVAKMLNDKLETVINEYDHTAQQDGVRILGTSVDQAERELKEELGR
jgi:hypothetical protein